MKEIIKNRVCERGIWDETVPAISFDSKGISNYAHIFNKLVDEFPRGKSGLEAWTKIVQEIKSNGENKKYDCIIGVSGGTDSSYLMHIVKKIYGLRPLAVNFDNGWSSDISVRNIKKVTSALDIDLETYVIDYEEMKEILKSYMRASLPWIDAPTDLAIKSSLYKIANGEKIKYVLNGHDFRSEGKQPIEWTYSDSKQLRFLIKKFGNIKLKTFPLLSPFSFAYYSYIKKIKMVKPLFYLEYEKRDAQKLLKEIYNWEYYGGHHHENHFTKFTILYWLRKKFNIDKRIITLSAQVLSGEITRNEALNKYHDEGFDSEELEKEKNYVIKKLGLSNAEFENMFNNSNKSFHDYQSYYPILIQTLSLIRPLLKKLIPTMPTLILDLDERIKLENEHIN